jgi:hypothetical protein
VLPQEAQHRARVPDRVAREESLVDDRRVFVAHDSGGNVPALPTGLGCAVVEVDVLAVHPIAGIPAADFLEHRAPQQQERAEHRVRWYGRIGALVEQVVLPLPAQRREQQTQRRAPHECCADRREAAARRLPGAVAVQHLRARDAAPRAFGHEVAQDRDRVRLRNRVGVRDQHELVLRLLRAEVRIGGERKRALVLEHADACRQPLRNAARDVRDQE